MSLFKALGWKRIARQQWRARIETPAGSARARMPLASPASNGGRGLKQVYEPKRRTIYARIARQQWRARIETTPASCAPRRAAGIARQQWRARIETSSPAALSAVSSASPASNGGRGLKLYLIKDWL